jgi:hypothetical protein
MPNKQADMDLAEQTLKDSPAQITPGALELFGQRVVCPSSGHVECYDCSMGVAAANSSAANSKMQCVTQAID